MGSMRFQKYFDQVELWPKTGRYILAHFDADSIYVYQAFRAAIADFAVEHQHFGGDFSYSRMSWIKPNFLWMMYRSGWATQEGQEHILAVRLRRVFFDELLCAAVPSTFDEGRFETREQWQAAVQSSEVRLQWDPDHDPMGNPLQRRALQLGLRGGTLLRYATKELVSIEDVTPFVTEQRSQLAFSIEELHTPEERVYLPEKWCAIKRSGIETPIP